VPAKSCILAQMPFPELRLIENIRTLAGRTAKQPGANQVLGGIRKGIGDDCAVLVGSKSHDLLVTTDLCIQDVHFRLDWHPPASVGHRCLARGLSDIAAMGGEPASAFLSLGIPDHLQQKWIDGFFNGFQQLAKRFAVTLAGGDVAANPQGITADIIVLGRVPKGKAILRSGAKPGDWIYVTGILGRSAEVLAALADRNSKSKPAAFAASHYFPQPRIKAGQWLREHRAITAMIDISDGLSSDMAHLCAESHVGAVLLREAIPWDRSGQRTLDARIEEDSRRLAFALHGGEDYELLFTAPRTQKVPATIAGVRVTRIGEIVRQKRGAAPLTIVQADGRAEPLPKGGWEHFSSSRMEDTHS
jgi:thiamine-monophosphate kinase